MILAVYTVIQAVYHIVIYTVILAVYTVIQTVYHIVIYTVTLAVYTVIQAVSSIKYIHEYIQYFVINFGNIHFLVITL